MPSRPSTEEPPPLVVGQTHEWREIPFDELAVGHVWHTTYELDAPTVRGFYALVGHEPGADATPGGATAGAITAPVSPMVFSTFTPMFRAMGGRMEHGTVQTHQVVDLHGAPAFVGDVLDVDVRLLSAEQDGDRRRVEIEVEFGRVGQPVCTTRSRYLWGYSRPGGTR